MLVCKYNLTLKLLTSAHHHYCICICLGLELQNLLILTVSIQIGNQSFSVSWVISKVLLVPQVCWLSS